MWPVCVSLAILRGIKLEGVLSFSSPKICFLKVTRYTKFKKDFFFSLYCLFIARLYWFSQLTLKLNIMGAHAICWHAVVFMCLLGREPLTPPPPEGLIWGEGRCVLLLVRNNHPRPITFTARRAFIAVTHWGLREVGGGGPGAKEGCVKRNHSLWNWRKITSKHMPERFRGATWWLVIAVKNKFLFFSLRLNMQNNFI